MTAPKLMQAAHLSCTPEQGLRTLVRAAALAAALAALCTAAHGESTWSRISKAIANKPEQQVANAPASAMIPASSPATMPMVPVENGPTSGSTEKITGLAVQGANGAQGGLDLGKESDDENISATDLFKNPEMRRLLGDKPKFVYNPQAKPDPMLVPWVRNAAIYAELAAAAEGATKSGDLDGAVAMYERIVSMKDARYTAVAQQKLIEMNTAKSEAAAKAAGAGGMLAKIELPPWVIDNTTGVIYSGGKSMALIGDDVVKVGDPLPKYPEIKVATIAGKKVTYLIQGKTFEVELKDPEAN